MKQALFAYYVSVIKQYVDLQYSDLISVEPPNDKNHGDFSTNIAMILSKRLGKEPVVIANELLEKLSVHKEFCDLSVKRPGFLNWRVPKSVLLENILTILDPHYGMSDIGCGKKVNVEYVSANPTGPLHAGHARGAVSGDVLANLLAFAGYSVTKEYYINDAGKQIEILALSLYHRYLELFELVDGQLPNWAYPGEYLIDTAKKIVDQYGRAFVDADPESWLAIFKNIAIEDSMNSIKDDLNALGVHHNVFFSELSLVSAGEVEKAVNFLKERDLIYTGVLEKPKGKEIEDWEAREQLLFRSTLFGDDVDRPLQKSDGTWTYFANDIAYHWNKINRNFDEMIDFWGADHGGYIKRMKAAVSAISDKKNTLEVKISQLVRFMQDGCEVRMSKRAGTFITAREVIDTVGKDVVRFMMITRRDDAPLDFDFKKVVEQSRDNPVFYVQYAYARIHSVFKQFLSTFKLQSMPSSDGINLSLLDDEDLGLVKIMLDWPRQVVLAAKSREPHRIAFFLSEIAAVFHSLWNQGKDNAQLRFVIADDYEKTRVKIIMLFALKNVLEKGFQIIGITPLEELR